LRKYLANARREGKSFDEVWQFAIVAATRGLERKDEQAWVECFGDMRGHWDDAYHRRGLEMIDRLLTAVV
jgi:hypothetical protein